MFLVTENPPASVYSLDRHVLFKNVVFPASIVPTNTTVGLFESIK